MTHDHPVRGYSHEAIEEFMRAADQEARRLEELIADSERRAARARAAIGTHRVMVAMLFTTQHRLDEMRRDAEAEAAAILHGAEREADAIVAAPSEPVLDLGELERPAVVLPVPVESLPDGPRISVPDRPEGDGDTESSAYFAFFAARSTTSRPWARSGN